MTLNTAVCLVFYIKFRPKESPVLCSCLTSECLNHGRICFNLGSGFQNCAKYRAGHNPPPFRKPRSPECDARANGSLGFLQSGFFRVSLRLMSTEAATNFARLSRHFNSSSQASSTRACKDGRPFDTQSVHPSFDS